MWFSLLVSTKLCCANTLVMQGYGLSIGGSIFESAFQWSNFLSSINWRGLSIFDYVIDNPYFAQGPIRTDSDLETCPHLSSNLLFMLFILSPFSFLQKCFFLWFNTNIHTHFSLKIEHLIADYTNKTQWISSSFFIVQPIDPRISFPGALWITRTPLDIIYRACN